ncbi:MAG: radical SAM protein [Chloroflexi bacterium]|nr:radical SAM protein [Chloroflexota bacterium]
MTDLLLIAPPSPISSATCVRDKGAMGFSKAGYVFPPYDLAMLAANIRDILSVKIIDANAKRLSFQEVGQCIRQENPKYVVFSNSTPTIDWDLNTAKITKQINGDIITITFGPHVTTLGRSVIEVCPELDVVIKNEQESVLRELVESTDINSISGTLVRLSDGTIKDNDFHTGLDDFGSLPFPAHDLLDLNLYSLPYAKGHPVSATMTARGCPGRCIFCVSSLISKRFSGRSVEHILSEFRFLTEELGVHEIKVWDDTFTFDRQRALDICQSIVEERIRLSWTCNTRVDKIDSELLASMKEAGCHTVSLGVESGNDGILRSIGKEITTSDIRKGFALAKAANIERVGFFMLGHPQDTRETMEQTINFAKELRPDYASFNMVVPFPGTPLFRLASKEGWIKTTEWSKYESTSYPVYESPNVSRDEVYQTFKRAYRQYYFTPRYVLKRLGGIRSVSDLSNDIGSGIGLIKMLARGDRSQKDA